MDDKTVQDYSKWFTHLERLNRHLERWLIAHRGQVEDDKASLYRMAIGHFERYVLPLFKDHEERMASDDITLRKQGPWLEEFRRRTGTFRKTLEMFRTQPAQLSDVLSNYTDLLYCEIMLLLWRKEDLSGGSLSYDDLKPVHHKLPKSLLPDVPNSETPAPDSVDWHLARYAFASEKSNNVHAWREFASRVEAFANIIGCSAPADKTGYDVFSSVNAINKKCFDTDSSAREAELQAKIDLLTKEKAKLEETAREWTRMQATLSFRHVLERLPPPSDKKESANWADFWKKAVEEATKPGAKNTELARIVKDYRTLKGDSKDATKNASKDATKNASKDATKDIYDHAKVRNTGAGLYSGFSENIHHYTGYYDLQPSQWDILQWKILKLLTPLAENIEDGEVQWDRERLRFITPVEKTLATPAPASPAALHPVLTPGASSSAAPPNPSASSPSAK
ncbi:MAG: hypothetical protein HETSPECPRED_000287 [Heterodermia speciosa]|uniref:Uncharacterized protein n=1 Tax=Heterodermia speciosa TaxID=116794 RepID=A0A8H3EYQ6_9LECA|nr:MAG: hypothetical protein HETSPECPRED_000287 [Heterodermia speciosa]